MATSQNMETPEQGESRRRKIAGNVATSQNMETPEQAESRRRKIADNVATSRNMETPEQAESRRRKVADNMANLRNMETPKQADSRRINNARNMAFWRSSSATIQINQNQNEVPQISKNVETEEAKQKAFYHMMKTKIGNDELISEEIRETINNVIKDPNNETALQIPFMNNAIRQMFVFAVTDSYVAQKKKIGSIKEHYFNKNDDCQCQI